MRVEVFERGLPAATRWQAVTAMRLQWPEVFAGAARRARHPCPPEAGPVHFVVRDEDVLVSFAVVLQSRAWDEHRELRVAGLGSVFTFPQYRREGWSRAVVGRASGWIATSDADLGLLFCSPLLVPGYEAHGWTVLAGGVRTGPAGELSGPDCVAMQLVVPQSGGVGRLTGPVRVPHLW